MAKTRSQKGQQTEVEVSKVSEDKVKKSQKEKKAKAAPKEEVKESESSSDGPEAAGVQKQDDGEKVEESKSSSDSSSSSSDSASEDASEDSSSDSEDAEGPTKSKQPPVEVEPNSIFTIDTKPTKASAASAAPEKESGAAEEEAGSKEDGGEGSKMNRRARRRLQLIGKQREALRKSMNLGPDDNSAELQAALDKWIQDTDGKAEVRDTKKKQRKERDAQRLRTRKGKLLKGRKLKERKKALDKVARREQNQAKRQAETAQES